MGYDTPKQFIPLLGRPVLSYAVELCCNELGSDHVILVLPEAHQSLWLDWLRTSKSTYAPVLALGGSERYQSVLAGISAIPAADGVVAICDAVRPFSGAKLLHETLNTAESLGSGVAAVPVTDSLRIQSQEGWKHVQRTSYRAIQTPQSFRLALLRDAYNEVDASLYTDDASVFEAAGHTVQLVEGHYRNIKLTTPTDLSLAEILLKELDAQN
jgi:2-C-methyl-D-erythritol 4-phosphate cytidylyltransferase